MDAIEEFEILGVKLYDCFYKEYGKGGFEIYSLLYNIASEEFPARFGFYLMSYSFKSPSSALFMLMNLLAWLIVTDIFNK